MNKQIHDYLTVITAVLAAMLLASHQLSQSSTFGVFGAYAYWLFRVLIEVGCFFAVLVAIEKYFEGVFAPWLEVVVAIVISLVPFTLAITAFDLIAGLPELGLNGSQQSGSRVSAFALELVYLFDNHVALCLLVLLPRWLSRADTAEPEVQQPAVELEVTENGYTAFLESIDPPLKADIVAIEAQEHYIRISTDNDTRMVLHRFSDAVRHLPDSLGMQVHRSHWVADKAVRGLVVKGQRMQVELSNGTRVPVSRTFRSAVEQRFEKVGG
jgi:hypothetical protein